MNLEYYYYAVKYLARTAQMSEEEANAIASYCALIEDSDSAGEIRTDYAKLSQEVIDRNLYQEDMGDQVRLELPKTAVLKKGDTAADYKKEETQWRALLPFHYFPAKIQVRGKQQDYFTAFLYDIQANSILKAQFETAKEEYKSSDSSQKEKGLMRLGILAHIVAASAANEWLNSFDSWVNEVELLNANDYHTGAEYVDDAEKHYNSEELKNNPRVGHARLGTATGDSSICGNFSQRQSKDVELKTRNHQYGYDENVIRASKTIFNMLLMVRGKEPEHWKSDLNGAVRLILATANQWCRSEPELGKVWKEKTGLSYDYQYSSMRAKLSTAISSLCNFIIVVDDFRNAVAAQASTLNLPHTNIKHTEIKAEQIAANESGILRISPVKLEENMPQISILGYTADPNVKSLQTNVYNSRERLLKSLTTDLNETGFCEQDLSLDFCGAGEYTLTSILMQPQPEKAEGGKLEVLGIQMDLLLSEPSGRILLNVPGIEQSKKSISIANGFVKGDLNYPENLPYRKDGETYLDLYLPASAEILVDGPDTILGLKALELSFDTQQGVQLRHNGAALHHRVALEEHRAVLLFPSEWKQPLQLNSSTSMLSGHLELNAQLWIKTDVGVRLFSIKEKSTVEINLLWQL